MWLDMQWADGICFEIYIFVPNTRVKFFMYVNVTTYEKRMHNGKFYHAEASYYSGETWLRTQNVTPTQN